MIHNHARPSQPVGRSTLDTMLGGILKTAGVTGSAHVFRETLATSLIENGVREDIVDRIMGWAPRTVRNRHYVPKSGEAMMQAILLASRRDPITLVP